MGGEIREKPLLQAAGSVMSATKEWGRYLLVSGLIACSAGCGQSDKKAVQEKSGMWAEPYDGKIDRDENGNFYMDSRFIIKFTETLTIDAAGAVAGGRVTGQIPQTNTFEIEVSTSDSGTIDTSIEAAAVKTGVDYAGRNYYFLSATNWDNEEYITNGASPYPIVPDDYRDKGLWWSRTINLNNGLEALQSSGQTINPVTIAVIDSAFNLNLDYDFKNPEIPYVEQQYHYDFGDGDNDVNYITSDGMSHGSVVAAFAAARNNGVRTNGVAPIEGTRVLPFKVARHITDESIIQYAIDLADTTLGDNLADDFIVTQALRRTLELSDELNIKVVNMSFGAINLWFNTNTLSFATSRYDGQNIRDAIADLNAKGIIVVAAAGNDNNDACRVYPSAFPYVISVGGTSIDSSKNEGRYFNTSSSASNYLVDPTNTSCLEIAAPAQDVLAFDQNAGPRLSWGTSFSAPQVAGLAALIKSVKPNATFDEVVALLRDNADDITLGNDPNPQVQGQTWKRINVEKTINALLGSINSSDAGIAATDAGIISSDAGTESSDASTGLTMAAICQDNSGANYTIFTLRAGQNIMADQTLACSNYNTLMFAGVGPDGVPTFIDYDSIAGNAVVFEQAVFANSDNGCASVGCHIPIIVCASSASPCQPPDPSCTATIIAGDKSCGLANADAG